MGRFKSFDEFLDLFPARPRLKIKGGYNVLCPAHDDHDPSLSISLNNHKILLDCKAGCQNPQILAALNLSQSDLFLNDSQAPIITNTYPYPNKDGQLLYEIVRYNPKTFKVRRPGNNGDWDWGLGNIKPALYHLPDIVRAIAKGDNIYVTEGEKDCDSLWKLGLVATTNPFGAGKWKPEYSEMLSGAKAIIVPDNDDEGRKHASIVIKSLEGKAKSLAVVEIPQDAKDISEWLEQGHSQEDFLSLSPVTPNEYKNTTLTYMPSESSNNPKSGQLAGQHGTTFPAKWGELSRKFDEIMSEGGTGWQDKRDIAEQVGTTSKDESFRKLLQRRRTEDKIRVHGRNPYLIQWINRDYKVTQLSTPEKQTFLNLKLPLSIEALAQIPSGSVIGVAGYVSSGKTAFLLEMAELNAFSQPMPVYYWYNEMSESKMVIRCEDFPLLIDAWKQKKFFPVKQGDFEFSDVIEADGINLIDYLDRDEELYLIGRDIKQLQRRLNNGIVVFAQQMQHNAKFGYGGLPSAKLSNLYITLDMVREAEHSLHGRAKIMKCKDWEDINPVYMTCDYYTGGKHGKLFIDSDWEKNQGGIH